MVKDGNADPKHGQYWRIDVEYVLTHLQNAFDVDTHVVHLTVEILEYVKEEILWGRAIGDAILVAQVFQKLEVALVILYQGENVLPHGAWLDFVGVTKFFQKMVEMVSGLPLLSGLEMSITLLLVVGIVPESTHVLVENVQRFGWREASVFLF